MDSKKIRNGIPESINLASKNAFMIRYLYHGKLLELTASVNCICPTPEVKPTQSGAHGGGCEGTPERVLLGSEAYQAQ